MRLYEIENLREADLVNAKIDSLNRQQKAISLQKKRLALQKTREKALKLDKELHATAATESSYKAS